ncbi:uncharacterized protein LOC135845826 [Planococcus citri]|uniref:uncharacterized protein LOC135845826 n=1 Tax=Planococcus citri TaxID=170843 RepID=UPI0031F840C9
MTSNTRLSILKPGKSSKHREPLQDVSQMFPNNDEEETTTTDNHKRRVSFACVNKVKEFEKEAECTTLHQTPAYDERFSISSDSYQSSISEHHNKSTFLSFGDTSKILSRSKGNAENIDVVELGLHNVSRGAPSPGKMSAGEASMDITSVIMRGEYTDFESSTETYSPLNLTKGRPSMQFIDKSDISGDKDILDSSSMETTEALPCLMTETIVTDFESFNETSDVSDVSVVEMEIDEEKSSRLSMMPEKVLHIRESTTYVTEKNIRVSIDNRSTIRNDSAMSLENDIIRKNISNRSTIRNDSAMSLENDIIRKDISNRSTIRNDSAMSLENDIIRKDISDVEITVDQKKNSRRSMVPEKVLHVRKSTTFVVEKDIQYSVEAFDDEKHSPEKSTVEVDLEISQEDEMTRKDISDVEMGIDEEEESRPSMAPEKVLQVRGNATYVQDEDIQHPIKELVDVENSPKEPIETEPEISRRSEIITKDDSVVEEVIDEQKDNRPSTIPENVLENTNLVPEKDIPVSVDVSYNNENAPETLDVEADLEISQKIESISKDVSDIEMKIDEQMNCSSSIAQEEISQVCKNITLGPEEGVKFSVDEISGIASPPKISVPETDLEISQQIETIQTDISMIEIETNEEKSVCAAVLPENILPACENTDSVPEKDITTIDAFSDAEKSPVRLNIENEPEICQKNESIQKEDSVIEMEINERKSCLLSTMPEKVLQIGESITLAAEKDIQSSFENPSKRRSTEIDCEITQKSKMFRKDVPEVQTAVEEEKNHPQSTVQEKIPQIRESIALISEREIQMSDDTFGDIRNSPKRPNTITDLEISRNNEIVRNQVEKTLQSGEIPYWNVVSMTDSKWDFEALWSRLHLIVMLPKNETKYSAKLSFVKKGSGIGDEILKIAIAPIIRKYRKKMDELCGRVEDVIIFMKMTLPHIKFAENFANDFSKVVEYESISLDNGFASFAVAHFERNFDKNILATITVDMRNIEEFSDSSIQVKQKVGNLDEVHVRKIFFKARGDFNFFSKFVKELNRELDKQEVRSSRRALLKS